MKSRLSFIHILLFPVLMFSCTDELSEIQKRTFIKFYGSYLNDAGRDVKTIASGGYAITGSLVPDSISRMFLIITDEAGNQVEGSPYYYGGQYRTAGNTLLVLKDGYLLGGSLTDTTSDGEFQTDMYLVRTDHSGREIWSHSYGNDENDDLFHVIESNTGGFVLAGKKMTDEEENLWIMKVDEYGNILNEFVGSALNDDDEANYLIKTDNGYLCACTYDDGALEGTDILLVHLDEECNPVSVKALGTAYDDYARTIIRYNEGYLVMGYTENTSVGRNEIQVYTFTLENNLFTNVRKLVTISDPAADLTGEDCVINSLGEIAIIGTRESNENRKIFLEILDGEGDRVMDPKLFGGSGNQSGKAIDVTVDGGLIFSGSNSQGGNSLITLVKTDARGDL